MNKYKIGMEIELDDKFNYSRAIITDFGYHEEKNEPLLIVKIIHDDKTKASPMDERWIYYHQVYEVIE